MHIGILNILGSVDKMMKKCDVDGDDAIGMGYDMEHNKETCLATCFKRRAFKSSFFPECGEIVSNQSLSTFNINHSGHASATMEFLMYTGVVCCIAALGIVIRTWVVFRSIHRPKSVVGKKRMGATTMKTLVVLGSGGHTTEMLNLVKNLDISRYTPLIYVVATTDTTSIERVAAFEEGRKPDLILKIPRSREVGQSYLSSIATTLWSFLFAARLVLNVRPSLVLCNGPGTCLPIAVMTLILRILCYCEGKIVFVESFCRVTRYVLPFVLATSTCFV